MITWPAHNRPIRRPSMSSRFQILCLAASLSAMLIALSACQPAGTQPAVTEGSNAQPLELWYTEPATAWTEALPLGNGRLGAMVFGGIEREVLQLNEDTVWAGGPQNNVKPSLKPHLEKVAELVLANRHEEAQAYADEHIKSHHDGMPYQTVGNLVIDPQHPAQADDYRRTLDIGQSLAQVRYQVDGVTYQRETFAALSAPVIVTRWTASEAGKLDLDLGFNSPMEHSVSVDNQRLRVEG